MTAAAPRLDSRIRARLERLAVTSASAAEIRRDLVTLARELEVPPPSYEHVRRLVVGHRPEVAYGGQLIPVAVGVALGLRHGNDLVRLARGEPVR